LLCGKSLLRGVVLLAAATPLLFAKIMALHFHIFLLVPGFAVVGIMLDNVFADERKNFARTPTSKLWLLLQLLLQLGCHGNMEQR
jgi:hypothetical protein